MYECFAPVYVWVWVCVCGRGGGLCVCVCVCVREGSDSVSVFYLCYSETRQVNQPLRDEVTKIGHAG